MHTIIWDTGVVSMVTDSIDSVVHKHWMLQLFFLPQGSMELEVDGKRINGNCILVNTNRMHSFITMERIHFSMLVMPDTLLGDFLVKEYLKDASYYDFTSMLDEMITDKFNRLIHNTTIKNYVAFRDFLFELWRLPVKVETDKLDERIKQVIRFYHSSMEDKTRLKKWFVYAPNVEELANMTALSPSRLAHLFKENIGAPLKSYLVLQNIFVAFRLLLDGENITDAALAAGFDSPSHFATTTKKMMGTSATLAVKDSEFMKVPLT